MSRQTSNGDEWPVEFKQAGETAECHVRDQKVRPESAQPVNVPKCAKKGRSDGRGKGASCFRHERKLTRSPFLTF